MSATTQAPQKAIAQGLAKVLANSYFLFLKTHNFHWNVTGPQFQSLHAQFMEQYTELFNAVDLVAERIRALGFFAPGSFAEYSKLAVIQEAQGNPSATSMIEALAADQQTMVELCKPVLDAATEAGDDVTVDLMVRRMDIHAKYAWMLRTMLPNPVDQAL